MMIPIILILISSGCASLKNAERLDKVDKISTMTTTCNTPYKLTQDCSNLYGAKKNIVLGDYKLSIFGNQKGNVVGIMTRSIWFSGVKKVNAIGLLNDNKMFHSALDEIEKILNQKSINIKKIVLMKSFGSIDGYFLELDGDGYTVLKGYE